MANTKQVEIKWEGGLAFEGRARSEHVLRMGSHAGLSGFSPMELLLMGLAGCTAMDVISILQKKKQDVLGFEVRVAGARAEEHPKVYTDIEIEFIVRGRGVQREAVERAVELSATKYCSASAMLEKAAPIRRLIRIEEMAPQEAPA